jgi:hypothetical protein
MITAWLTACTPKVLAFAPMMALSPQLTVLTVAIALMAVATEARTGVKSGVVVPPTHPVHTLTSERLGKILKHNPVLLPHHPDHHDNPLLDFLPKTLSISPADLGGDPTGRADSTWAVQVSCGFSTLPVSC